MIKTILKYQAYKDYEKEKESNDKKFLTSISLLVLMTGCGSSTSSSVDTPI